MSEGKNSEPSPGFETVVPNRVGKDLRDKDNTLDGHIRIETWKGHGTQIYVDLFDSSVDDANEAYIASESFPKSIEGANEATKYLANNGFQIVVVLR